MGSLNYNLLHFFDIKVMPYRKTARNFSINKALMVGRTVIMIGTFYVKKTLDLT